MGAGPGYEYLLNLGPKDVFRYFEISENET